MYEIVAWLVAMVLLFAIEAATINLVSIWFAIGSLGGLITAIAGGPVWLQIVVFVVVSAITLVCTRPFVKRFVNPKRQATNADALIGQTCLVLEDINNQQASGLVQCKGNRWTARSADGSVIPAGSEAEVAAIEGVKLMVVPVKQPAVKQ